MENSNAPDKQVPLTAGEMQVIDQFRRQKSTAVLTILFTDIKGFTAITEEHGEAYSNQLRRHHDAVVVPVIEAGGGGRVIKHIGDSVMAVFSEPSTAVARALEVQEKIAAFNKAHPELENISVRMGLHSGQVTTEDDVNADVFGRHVNRAARVEALADGGQVLVTYSVYDSARGWLNEKSATPIGWEKHGRYALKGIPEAVEIYEPYNPKLTKPQAPAGALVASGMPAKRMAGAALGLILLAGVGTYFGIQFANSTPEISVVDYQADEARFPDGSPFLVGGEPGQHIRPVLTPLKKGHYLINVDSSQIVRFFAPLDIKPGKNLLQVKFQRDELPGMTRRIEYSKEGPNTLTESTDETYTTYDAQGQPQEKKAHIDMALKAELDSQNDQKVKFTCTYTVLVDGRAVAQGTVNDENMMDNSDPARKPQQILWSDDFHFYYLSYYMSSYAAEFNIEANYADYKGR